MTTTDAEVRSRHDDLVARRTHSHDSGLPFGACPNEERALLAALLRPGQVGAGAARRALVEAGAEVRRRGLVTIVDDSTARQEAAR